MTCQRGGNTTVASGFAPDRVRESSTAIAVSGGDDEDSGFDGGCSSAPHSAGSPPSTSSIDSSTTSLASRLTGLPLFDLRAAAAAMARSAPPRPPPPHHHRHHGENFFGYPPRMAHPALPPWFFYPPCLPAAPFFFNPNGAVFQNYPQQARSASYPVAVEHHSEQPSTSRKSGARTTRGGRQRRVDSSTDKRAADDDEVFVEDDKRVARFRFGDFLASLRRRGGDEPATWTNGENIPPRFAASQQQQQALQAAKKRRRRRRLRILPPPPPAEVCLFPYHGSASSLCTCQLCLQQRAVQLAQRRADPALRSAAASRRASTTIRMSAPTYGVDQPTYCYLSLTRTSSAGGTGAAGADDSTSSSADENAPPRSSAQIHAQLASYQRRYRRGEIPLITIAVPPNCQFVSDDDALLLSATSSCESGVFECSAATPANFGQRTTVRRRTSILGRSDSYADAEESDDDEEDGDSIESEDGVSLESYETCPSVSSERDDELAAEVSISPPPPRQWISTVKDPSIRSWKQPRFTVLCYNVLCEKYASQNLYSYCPSWALHWDYRKKAIMEEIKTSGADIITLQEVETEQYQQLFHPELATLGYAGIFSPKSRAKTMADADRAHVDGCAIFWKTTKFTLVRQALIEFTQLAIASAHGSERMLNRVMTRDNIAIAAVLKIEENIYGEDAARVSKAESFVGSPLVVSTAHIHWDPELCDVKLIQSMMLVQELAHVLRQTAETWSTLTTKGGRTSPTSDLLGDTSGGGALQNGTTADEAADAVAEAPLSPSDIPFLVCGDLNSLPESGVFEYLTSGRIPVSHPDLKEFKGDMCLLKLSTISENAEFYTHPLRLSSAYDSESMPFTNYTFDFKGTIDYVFASTPSLVRRGYLGPLDSAWFAEHKIIGCPHPHVPSDHIPLLVEYGLVQKNQREASNERSTAGYS